MRYRQCPLCTETPVLCDTSIGSDYAKGAYVAQHKKEACYSFIANQIAQVT